MSTSTEDLLSFSADEYREPAKFPPALYRMRITDALVVPYHWKANAAKGKPDRTGLGVAFVTEPVACLSAEGDDDEANEFKRQLEEFGDWQAMTFKQTYTDRESKKEMLGVGPTSFALQTSDKEPAPGSFRFYQRNELPDGTSEYSGFACDVLGLEFPPGTSTGDIIKACVGQEFLAQFGFTTDQEGKVRPYAEMTDVAMAQPE